jgi:uncharacterized protein (TIGR01777 family)
MLEREMKIAVSGASGLLGAALLPRLAAGGDDVRRLVRGGTEGQPDAIAWDPEHDTIDAAGLGGVEAVVHLAGENIAAGRWTEERKRLIRSSRVDGTHLVAGALAKMTRPPRVLVCASAVGFYGPHGDETLDESAPPGGDFLAGVCREWEAAADAARAAGVRVVHLRFGVVLSPQGGALAKMLRPFKLGLGGRLGSGRQWMSWVSIEDAVGAVAQALHYARLEGPVNVVAPYPLTNAQFAKTLGRAVGRPAILPMPAFAARFLFGEMADALLLAGVRVVPAKLQASGYEFRHPNLEGALRLLLPR